MTITEAGYRSDQAIDLSKAGLEQCLDKLAEALSIARIVLPTIHGFVFLVRSKEPQAMNDQDASRMLNLSEMDETVTLQQQMRQEVGPVILINKFTVTPEEVDQLLAAWSADAAFFKRQPGFISAQLHRGIGGSCVFINYAVWESVEQFRQAFSQPEFQAAMKAYPPSTMASPHLFQKLAVPNICVA